MRIGVGAPPKGTQGSGGATFITSLMSEPWLAVRPDGAQTERIAVSWSWDESRTTLRLKLRPDVKFHDLPPVNGRVLDVDDVVFSWKRFETNSVSRSSVANCNNNKAG